MLETWGVWRGSLSAARRRPSVNSQLCRTSKRRSCGVVLRRGRYRSSLNRHTRVPVRERVEVTGTNQKRKKKTQEQSLRRGDRGDVTACGVGLIPRHSWTGGERRARQEKIVSVGFCFTSEVQLRPSARVIWIIVSEWN